MEEGSVTPDGWRVFKTKEYKLVTTRRSWSGQQEHCVELGGQLASVPNMETCVFITGLMKQSGSGCHIGGKYSKIGDDWLNWEWTWVDGTAWGFENWADGEPTPNLMVREPYITVEINAPWGAEDGQWNSVGHNDNKFGMCQRPKGNDSYFVIERKNGIHLQGSATTASPIENIQDEFKLLQDSLNMLKQTPEPRNLRPQRPPIDCLDMVKQARSLLKSDAPHIFKEWT